MVDYKQTDVGLIPVDWEVKKLEMVANFSNGKAHELFINENGGYIVVNSKFISTQGKVVKYSYKNFHPLKTGDITMVMSDIPNGKALAKCYLIPKENKYALNQRICSIRVTNCNNIFLSYLLNRNKYYLSFDSGTGQTNLKKQDVVSCPIPLPPLPEQEAIAEVLSDTDALIGALEKRIAKKRLIKQGAMQTLLTAPARRGGKDDWEVKSLIELAEYKKQLFDDGDWIESEHITNKGVRLIQTGNIGVGKYLEQKSKKYIYPDSFIKLNCKLLQKGDLLICRLAEPAGRACILPNINEKNVITSVDVTIFRPNINIVNRIFLNYVFSTHEWFNKVYESVGGTTHKRISRGSLGKIEILLPPIQEQNRIATILSDMDNEINALEKKLSKTKELKQGLMQQLLTGKIRLV